MSSHRALPLLFFGLMFCLAPSIKAQTLTEDNRLTFGEIVMRNNASQQDITLFSNGSYTADPAYYFYSEPELGEYTVTGQVPNHIMDITVDVASTSIQPSGGGLPFFTLVNPFTVPAVVTTNGAGTATFQIGATLRSNGSGAGFGDSAYDGVFIVTVTPQ